MERIFVEFPDIGVAAAESKAVLTENAADFSIAWPVANLAPFREMAVEGRMALQYDESGRFGATRAIEVGGAVLEDYVLSWRWTAFNRTGSRFLEARTFLENLVKHATFEVIGHDQTGKKVQLLIPQTVLLEIGERVAVPGVWPDCEPTLVLVENEEWRANPPIDRVIGIVHRTGATFELALHSRKRGLEIRWLWNTELEEEFFAVQQDIRQKERELKGFKAQCATIKRLLKQDSASSSDRDSKPRSGRRPRPRPSRTQLRSLEMTCRGLETEIRTAQTKRKALAQARRLVRWDDDTIEEITDLPVVYLIAERSEVIIAKVEIVK